MTTRYGTSYFVDWQSAVKYYRPQYDINTIERKFLKGDFHIGAPRLKTGEKLVVVDNGTRYAIESDN
jgi:hypothetical protein